MKKEARGKKNDSKWLRGTRNGQEINTCCNLCQINRAYSARAIELPLYPLCTTTSCLTKLRHATKQYNRKRKELLRNGATAYNRTPPVNTVYASELNTFLSYTRLHAPARIQESKWKTTLEELKF
jgi:hypothetical protein